MTYWAIILNNYLGEDEKYYFENYDLAKISFDALVKKHSKENEFKSNENSASWFDPNYNEYSTYVYLIKTNLIIHNKIIDDWD